MTGVQTCALPISGSRSSTQPGRPAELDITQLDMKNPEHRALYKEYRKTHGIA